MALTGKTILIAEDEPDLREILSDELRSFGCTVLEADNGRSAMALIQREQVDLIISDIRMPGGDGVELLRSLQKRPQGSAPLILITGYCDITEGEALSLGARRMFLKPFDLRELVNEAKAAITAS